MLSPASWQSGGRRQHSNSEPGLKQDFDFDWLLTSVGEQAWFWLIAFICWWASLILIDCFHLLVIAFICWWASLILIARFHLLVSKLDFDWLLSSVGEQAHCTLQTVPATLREWLLLFHGMFWIAAKVVRLPCCLVMRLVPGKVGATSVHVLCALWNHAHATRSHVCSSSLPECAGLF